MINALTKYQPLDVEKAKPIYNAEDEAVYIGSTMHHPYEDDKFILLSNPMTDDATFIEFKKSDLRYAEESSSITTENGESLKIMKVHMKVGGVGIRYEPFIIAKAINLKY